MTATLKYTVDVPTEPQSSLVQCTQIVTTQSALSGTKSEVSFVKFSESNYRVDPETYKQLYITPEPFTLEFTESAAAHFKPGYIYRVDFTLEVPKS